MNVLVTGGSGFIGGYLVGQLLDAEHVVSIYDSRPSHYFPTITRLGDVRDRDDLTQAVNGKEVIFHLAAEHRDDVKPVSLYQDVNVKGAANVVAAAKATGCRRVIFTSSVAVYPLNAGCPDEEFLPVPFNAYGESKLAAEKLFREWAEHDPEVSVTVVRPCVVFGEGNRGNVYNLLKQIQSGRFIMVGDGRNRKSLAYVRNLVPFLISRMGSHPGFHVFNYADKPDLSTDELVRFARQSLRGNGRPSRIRVPYAIGVAAGYCCDIAAAVLGRGLPISYIRVKKFCADTTVDAGKVDRSGFKAPFSIEEGLRRMIEADFLKHPDSRPAFEGQG